MSHPIYRVTSFDLVAPYTLRVHFDDHPRIVQRGRRTARGFGGSIIKGDVVATRANLTWRYVCRTCGSGRGRAPSVAVVAGNDIIDCMASLTIRQLDESTKVRLRMRAAGHGRSMEEEARDILKVALNTGRSAPSNLAESIRRRFAAVGGVKLPDLKREPMREPPQLSK
jgi:antitoxin FitA